jgi:hypothetical protein
MQNQNQEVKNLITEIAVKRPEISKLQKELSRLEREDQEELWRRYTQ